MRKHYFSGWLIAAIVLATIVLLPLMAIMGLALTAKGNIWPYLSATILPIYLFNTLMLMLGVAVGSTLIGVTTAWLITRGPFPLSGFFTWGLLLPLALPAYLVAYIYTDLLEYAGPLQQALRALFGWSSARDYWFPEVRSLPGAILMLSLVLYPYVYLLARAAFLNQMVCVLEASRTLGRGPSFSFFFVALPLARPAIFAGVMLVLMETLNDFGTVDFFGVPTLTAGVFDVWLRMGDIGGAAQLALVLLAMATLLVTLEHLSRRRQRFCLKSHRCGVRQKLPPPARWSATFCCALPIGLGFVIPTMVLAGYTLEQLPSSPDFLEFAYNSLLLSLGAAALAIVAALAMSYARRLASQRLLHQRLGSRRLSSGWAIRAVTQAAALGYALPGAVIAIGILVTLAQLDHIIISLQPYSGLTLLLSGSLFALLLAYLVRYLAIAFNALESSFAAISPNLDAAASTLGASRWQTLTRVHLPLLWSGLLSGILLVFVDGMKELPATLLLRPFQFETLATYVYQYASDERLAECAPGALMIVAVCLLPVLVLARALRWSPSWNSSLDHDSSSDPPIGTASAQYCRGGFGYFGVRVESKATSPTA